MAPPLRVALATCRELPDLDPDNALLIPLLQARGIDAVAAVWDDPDINWHAFDLVILRATWDYTRQPQQFLAWADSIPHLLNPPDIVVWNSDKRYLKELEQRRIPTVPTTFVRDGEPCALPSDDFVVKPTVGAGSKDASRYRPDQSEEARQHVARLHATGRVAMIQPYLAEVETAGEIGLVYIGNKYSHAIRKGPMLTGNRSEGSLFVEEEIRDRPPTPAERQLAEQVLAQVPGGRDRLLYARVDLLAASDGSPVLLELELIEPSLFFETKAGSAERMAEAIATEAQRAWRQ